MTQKGDTSQSHEMDQIRKIRENLPRNTDNNQIQLNSIKFNRNQ